MEIWPMADEMTGIKYKVELLSAKTGSGVHQSEEIVGNLAFLPIFF